MIDLPWDGLSIPDSKSSFTTKLVNSGSKWDEFWALDFSGNPCFLVSCGEAKIDKAKLPKLQELDVRLFTQANGETFLLFLIHDTSFKSIFYEFCLRIIDAIEPVGTSDELVKQALLYTWSWYRFLKGKTSGILTPEEQRGLIGEIRFIRDLVASKYAWAEALVFWVGPFGNPKDFVWSSCAVEVKTHMNTSKPFIKISSEFQLDTSDFSKLWIVTLGFQRVSADSSEGNTLTEIVDEIMEHLAEIEPSAIENFTIHLAACGFSFTHDYSEYRWKFDEFKSYDVRDGFPSIQSTRLDEGVSDVRYKVALISCQQFEVPIDDIKEHLNES
jgi:hypothetical protein